jgi:hypothetical protein
MSSSRERGKTVSKEEKKGKAKKKATLSTGATRYLGYGLVVMFLMVWVFILGVLTGRGDVNRLFQRLGLYKTTLAARLGMDPDKQATPALPVASLPETNKALADAGKKPAQEPEAAEKAAAAAPAAKATEVAASTTAAESGKKSASVEAKKSKGTNQKHEHEHERSLASRLSFQNSLDTPTKKQPKNAAKKEPTVHTASIAPQLSHTASEHSGDEKKKAEEKKKGDEKKKTACAYQVRVASYRTAEEAEKTVAELKKKGINASLEKGKDKTGQTFIIKTGRYSNKAEAEKVTKKLKEAKLSGQIQELKQ